MEQKELIKLDQAALAFPDQIKTFFDGIKAKYDKIIKLKTPKNKLKIREGKGGKTFTYVKSLYLEDQLNEYYPGWSLEVKETKVIGREGSGFAQATVKLWFYDNGLLRYIEDVGGCEIKYYKPDHPTRGGDYLDLPNDIKGAVTDGLKRCCYRLGFGRDFKYEPSDLDITEEQFGYLNYILESFNSDGFQQYVDKVKEIAETKLNQATFDKWIEVNLLPKLKEVDIEKYNKIKGGK